MKNIPRTVWILGLTSFFTDLSSEMIYPLLPVFLAGTLGASTFALGLIEGIAEATSSVLKVFSGFWADRAKSRKPLILVGYSISSFFRPLVAFATSWPFVLVIRFADRVGKGIRSSPRDALIADVTLPAHRGAAYGVQRSLDHAGAVLGPLLAAMVMWLPGTDLRSIFLFAAIPSFFAIAVLYFGLHETSKPLVDAKPKQSQSLLRAWSVMGKNFKFFLLSVGVFTLGNSTDAFLLVLLSKSGVSHSMIAILWSAQHGIKMLSTYLGGRFADRFGKRLMMGAGWCYFAIIYLCFAWVQSMNGLILVFLLYGFYYGFVEPSERALVADLVPANIRGSAFGYYHFMVGVGALPASLLFGWVWQAFGTSAAFMMGAGFAILATSILFASNQTKLNTA